jgi:hypothetical protein
LKLIAVDPGNVCGMASAEFEDGAAEDFQSWESEPYDAVRAIEIASIDPITVVYETFTPRPGVYTWQPDALYTIGAILYLSRKYGFGTGGQSPGDAKKFATNDKLAKLGWRSPSTGGHRDDAARHLLLGAVKMNVINLEVLL